MSKNSKICNFLAILTCYISKKCISYIEFNFKQKKYGLFQKKLEKITFLFFSVKSFSDMMSLIANFSNLCKEI